MNSQRWSELSPTSKALLAAVGMAQLILQVLAWRDLRRRPAADLRGPKWLWRLVLPIQPVGPIAYLAAGRKRSA